MRGRCPVPGCAAAQGPCGFHAEQEWSTYRGSAREMRQRPEPRQRGGRPLRLERTVTLRLAGHDHAVVSEKWTEAVWCSTLVPCVQMVALAAQETVRRAGPGAAVDVAALPALASLPQDLCAWAVGQLVERGWLRVQLDGPERSYRLLARGAEERHPSEAPGLWAVGVL